MDEDSEQDAAFIRMYTPASRKMNHFVLGNCRFFHDTLKRFYPIIAFLYYNSLQLVVGEQRLATTYGYLWQLVALWFGVREMI